MPPAREAAVRDAPVRPAALLTIEDVAARLSVTVRHIRQLVFERRIPYVKWGRLVRFDPEALERWLDGARHDPDAG